MKEQIIIHFEKAGMLTTIQDRGRKGNQAQGIPPGGFLDRKAAAIANWLVGNDWGAALFEITIMGPGIRFEGEGQIALTGADLSASLNGIPIDQYRTIDFDDGDELVFGRNKKGCRAYLAIGGTIESSILLNSQAALSQIPHFLHGSIIQKEDQVKIRKRKSNVKRKFPTESMIQLKNRPLFRVIPGPEFYVLDEWAKEQFYGEEHKVSIYSNRMGYRLESQMVTEELQRVELLSSGIIPGTIQLTPSGQMIVLLADAQTTGGYPRIANILTADLDLWAQVKPGDFVKFVETDLQKAQSSCREYHEFFKGLT